MLVTPANRVADAPAHHPGSIDAFERHGTDLCCGGRWPPGEFRREKGLGAGELVAVLQAVAAEETPSDGTWSDALNGHVHVEDDVLFPPVVGLPTAGLQARPRREARG